MRQDHPVDGVDALLEQQVPEDLTAVGVPVATVYDEGATTAVFLGTNDHRGVALPDVDHEDLPGGRRRGSSDPSAAPRSVVRGGGAAGTSLCDV